MSNQKPEDNEEIKKEADRKVHQVTKFLENPENVPKKYTFRMITNSYGCVYLKKTTSGETYHECVSMSDDLACISRIVKYIETEVENEILKEAEADNALTKILLEQKAQIEIERLKQGEADE